MKTANMEAGNRHLGRSSSLLFGGSTPSLLSSTPNSNGSMACLVSSVREKRPQRHSPAAELTSDFVWRRFLKTMLCSISPQTSGITNPLYIFTILHFCILVFLIFLWSCFSEISTKEWSKTTLIDYYQSRCLKSNTNHHLMPRVFNILRLIVTIII